MAAVEQATILTPASKKASRDGSLAAPSLHTPSKGGVSSSTTSVASSDKANSNAGDLKSSGDGALDKFKRHGSDDGHSETSSHRRRMSSMFKRGKRRKSLAPDEAPPGSLEDVPPLPSLSPHAVHQSEESLGLHKSIPSSLLTEDSDAEASPAPVRPTLSPHNSHAGYLTLSSPLIASETLDSATPAEASSPLAASATAADDSLRHAQTIDVIPNIKRSASPVGKLRDAFSPQRKSTPPKPPAEKDTSRPSTSGGLGALFGGKRPPAKGPEGPLVFSASPPQIHDGADTHSSPDLPLRAPSKIVTQYTGTAPEPAEAPATFVTPPTPTDAKPASPSPSTPTAKLAFKNATNQTNPNIVVSPSGSMISHRRARSATNPPSKLSNSIVPLTPTLEEIKTPGGTAVPPLSPTGFFTSVFSAAQNAATSLGSTIANTTTGKNKSNSQAALTEDNKGDAGGEEVIGPGNTADPPQDPSGPKRPLAVETLGSGDLSLAHLGIADSANPSPMSSTTNLVKATDEASAKAEDIAAAQAVSAAYAAEKPAGGVHERARSLTANSSGSVPAGAASPPRDGLDSPAQSSMQRQGSIRSRLSGGRTRRHRGSSATTGNTIAAAIGHSTSTLIPQASMNTMNGNRLNGTGFAVAPPRRNRDFHNLFKSVPEDDYLIEDYSAALQKEILLQGRLYVSEGHLCFSSNILGWVTNLVISFDEVVSVEKKSTAMLFPNGIVIQTLHARNIFASFLARDSTYDLIIGIWKISHPNLKSSLNGVTLDGSGTGDKTEKAESVASEDASEQESDDEVYDEDEEEGVGSFVDADGSVAGSEQDPVQAAEVRKVSSAVAQATSGGPSKLSDGAEAVVEKAAGTQDYPGAATHAPSDCGDNDQHYDKMLIDTTIPAPLGKIYSLLFGPASGVFMRRWLIDDQKSTELQMEDDKKGLGEDRKTMNVSYIKPLPGSIGPRQTKCNVAMTLEQFDLEKAVTVLCSTGTPDVPSGNAFLTKTRYCLMWGPNNSTRLIMTFTVEWSGKSWLKGPIEKGANDGQLSYSSALAAALRAAVSSKPVGGKGPAGKGGKGKKRSKALADEAAAEPTASASTAAKANEPKWGLLEPLRSLLGPVADIIDPLLDAKIIATLLFVVLLWTYFFRSPALSRSLGHPTTPAARLAAYEQIWQSEEAELWKWMEERVALDRVHEAAHGRRAQEARDMKGKLRDERMTQRQVDEAIRVTEERLSALKVAVGRGRGEGSGEDGENGTT